MLERHTPERLATGLAGGDEFVEPAATGCQRRDRALVQARALGGRAREVIGLRGELALAFGVASGPASQPFELGNDGNVGDDAPAVATVLAQSEDPGILKRVLLHWPAAVVQISKVASL